MNEKILIVDDEACLVNLLSRQLAGEGYRTWSAVDAEQAIALAREHDFDAIMLDLILKDTSGYGAIRSLKEVSDASILAMTGNADVEIEKDVMLLGADGLIGKPYDLRRLTSLLQDIISRREVVNAARAEKAV